MGVVKDFHFASLHSAISPLVLFNEEDQLHFMFVKLKPGNISDALAVLKAICANVIPHRPFEYEFLDQKRKRKVQEMKKLIHKFDIKISDLGLQV